jgi:universal stress protein A
MYQKILVPLDGSKISEYSLAHVSAIATGCNVPEVVLLRVVEPMPRYAELGEVDWAEIDRNAKAGAKAYLAKITKKLKIDFVNTKSVMAIGDPGEEILEYARKNRVDLIIMTSHAHPGIMKWLLGSTAERVVRHSPVSVLLVSPPKGKSKK